MEFHSGLDPAILRETISVLLVFGLLAVVVRKFQRGRTPTVGPAFWQRHIGSKFSKSSRTLEPIERIILTPQHALHVVRVNFHGRGRDLVLATHPHGCTILTQEAELDSDPALADDGEGARKTAPRLEDTAFKGANA